MQSLWKLSLGYFISYVGTGLAVKFFTGNIEAGFYGLNAMEYLVYSTAFSSFFCIAIVLLFRWHKRGQLSSSEKVALFFSGLCTAYIVPASTLIYSLPISVMIAMVLMRGTVIVASRFVDFILEMQGLQHKKITWQEELAVLLAVSAVAIKLLLSSNQSARFPLLGVILLSFYFIAYLLRLYIMNRAKLLGVAGKKLDQKLYYGIEQLFTSAILVSIAIPIFIFIQWNFSSSGSSAQEFASSITNPHPLWIAASLSGLPYAFVAFFSVFLFLYPGKSATFTGVLNRLVSLMGGTASSLILYFFFSASFPPAEDWWALLFILAAISMLAWGDWAEKRRKKAAALLAAN